MRKNKFKIISIVVLLSILLTLIPIRNIIIKAESNNELSFSIDGMTANPYTSILGDDITISGTIQPKEIEAKKVEQELIIVIDVSDKKDNSKNNYIDTISNDDNINKIINPLQQVLNKLNNINLRIGVVIYDSESKILKNNGQSLNNKDKLSLNSSIKSNSGIVNKNMGDALRQAVYLLDSSSENNSNANKTILLIGKGEVESRRIYNDDLSFCLDTTKEDIENTTIVPKESEKGLEYAKAVGSIIKNKGYNVFTVGFDITKNDVDNKNKDNQEAEKQKDILKQIHSSMTGYTDLNDINCEEKGLFLETRNPSDNKNDIERIFNKIFDNFNKEYYLNDVSLNFEFDNDITLKYGGNSIKLENIKYTLDEDSKMYKAEPIEFSFVVNAKKVGEQNVFKNLNINYSWKNKKQVQNLNSDLSIIVKNNNPTINIELIGEKIREVLSGNEIEVSYKINPQSFTNELPKITDGTIDEIMFIVDLSMNMGDANRFSQIQNGIFNSILNPDRLKASKFGVIGYNSNIFIGDLDRIENTQYFTRILNTNNLDDLRAPLFTNSDSNSTSKYKDFFSEIQKNTSTDNIRNIDDALKMTKNIFNKFGEKNKRKAIVLINSGSVNYSKEVVEKIKEENYKIISLDLSNLNNTNLKSLHSDLGGIIDKDINKSDYLTGSIDGQNYNNVNSDMSYVENRLYTGTIIGSYDGINPILNFDLNDNFDYIQESNSSNINVENYEGNKLSFKLNDSIVYKYNNEVVEGKYKYTADNKEISFKIKIKDNKTGKLGFASNDNTEKYNNYMNYLKFNSISTNIPIETPIFNVIPKILNISHGLYNGIANNKVDIKENTIVNGENNPLILAEKSTLVMGSTFNTSSNSIEASLNIDDNFEVVKASDIIVYKVINKNGVETIEKVEEENGSSYTIEHINGQTNKFKISINELNKNNEDIKENKILIVYKGSIKDSVSNKQLVNKIDFGSGVFKDFMIDISVDSEESPKLPDLF